MKKGFYLLWVLLVLAACSKEKEVVIPNNNAPPDSTIDDVVLESYVNRSYIILLGVQPNQAEMDQAKLTLRSHNVSQVDREAFLSQVMAQPGYPMRMYDVGRGLYLNGTDTTAINDEIFVLDLILADSAFVAFWPQAQTAKSNLLAVLAIPTDLASGAIDMRGMHQRLVTNKIYDDLNMGTQNFVVSMFQNFLSRYPTDDERAASELMVDGFSSQVFLVSGRNKTDFIDIFIHSRDYDEGQVRDLFSRYLYRSPTTEELETLSIAYRSNHDYKALQKAVMTIDEFVGL